MYKSHFFVLAIAVLASASQAQLVATSGAGSAVTAATNTATFDSIGTGTSLFDYQEDGLSVAVPNYAYAAFNPAGGNVLSGFSGGFHYPSGGANRATLIARTDGKAIHALEFVAGTGFGDPTTNLSLFGVRGGSVYSTIQLSVLSGSVVGVSDVLGFDALYVGAYQTALDAQGANIYSFQALAMDNLSVQAVPEPASMAALGVGALGLLKRRKKA